MKLSIIILNYNAAAFLEVCVNSVIRATKNIDAEIIVADNNSSDTSLEMLQSVFGDEVKVIAHEENYGFSKGNNLAVSQAQGEFLCILNPDTIVGEEVFEECLAFAKASTSIGFIGVQLLDGTGKYLPESKRHVPTPKVVRQKMLGNDNHYYFNEVGRNDRGAVEVLVGAFMFCNKKVYEDCGGFDERYFMYGEDIDLSYTAIQKGYQNYYLGDQKIIHFKGESTVKDKSYLKRFYGAMGLFYDKYFHPSALEKKAMDVVLQGMIALKPVKTAIHQERKQKSILISNQNDFSIESVLETAEFSEIPNFNLDHYQIIWDTHSLSIKKIITYMARNKNNSFRFLAANRAFYIGSDDSNSRGVVKNVL